MGKKGNWVSSIKKALIPESKEQKSNEKKKKKWFGKAKSTVPNHHNDESPPLILLEEMKLAEDDDDNDEQTKHAVAVAAAVAGKSKEEVAAIRIQTVFRGYMAKRALRALRGLVRLKAFMEGTNVNRQTTNTLKCMQIIGRVQAQIQASRKTILEQNQALQKQLLQRQAKEEILKMGDDWDDSIQSKEQLETGLVNKYEATMRRERALAYSYSHQQTWKKSAKPEILTFMNPNNPHWGWSWLERWTEAKENTSIAKKRPQLSKLRKLKSLNPKEKDLIAIDNDTRSVFSVQLERNRRRHSIAGSSIIDDLSSFPPSYMASTQSAKARLQSPLGLEINVTADMEVASVKKRLSFPADSPVKPRRFSGPPRIEINFFNKEKRDKNGMAGA